MRIKKKLKDQPQLVDWLKLLQEPCKKEDLLSRKMHQRKMKIGAMEIGVTVNRSLKDVPL